jgi:hypothetical protein
MLFGREITHSTGIDSEKGHSILYNVTQTAGKKRNREWTCMNGNDSKAKADRRAYSRSSPSVLHRTIHGFGRIEKEAQQGRVLFTRTSPLKTQANEHTARWSRVVVAPKRIAGLHEGCVGNIRQVLYMHEGR